MASDIHVQYRDDGRIAVISIDRPHRRNACDLRAWTDLRNAFSGLAGDARVRLAVLRGEGGHFCAGDDIVAFRGVLSDAQAADAYRSAIQACYAAVQEAPMPVVAAISGACVGGGCSLAMCCDFRVGDATAFVSVPVAKLGLVYPTIQLQRLVQLVGISAARRWLYTGERIGAQAALDSGFLDAQADGNVLDEALAFGASMLESAPLSIAGSKAQLNAIAAGRVAQEAGRIQALEARANASEDYRNAAEAFAAKRKPVFTGR